MEQKITDSFRLFILKYHIIEDWWRITEDHGSRMLSKEEEVESSYMDSIGAVMSHMEEVDRSRERDN